MEEKREKEGDGEGRRIGARNVCSRVYWRKLPEIMFA